jgi:hypothetical protein
MFRQPAGKNPIFLQYAINVSFFSFRARKSLSFDGLQRASSFSNIDRNPARPVKPGLADSLPLKSGGNFRHKYDHVQSKVRKYIDGSGRAASVGRAESEAKLDQHRRGDDDIYGKSFQLSPGENVDETIYPNWKKRASLFE